MRHLATTLLIVIFTHGCHEATNEPADGQSSAGCTAGNSVEEVPSWHATIQAERCKLAPMEESLLVKTTEQYNLDVGERRKWTQRCLDYRDLFEEVERLTLYPAEFVAGFAMHESIGCRMDVSDRSGGKGFMQLTIYPKEKSHRDAATALGIPVSELDPHGDPLHNIVVGVMVLDNYERQLGSRPHGILAYNHGVGGTRSAMRRAGWRKGQTYPEIVDIKPHLGTTPKIYTQRTIAGMIMMDRAFRGQDACQACLADSSEDECADPCAEPNFRKEDGYFTPDDVPGWYPCEDGE